jgi:hypothetical protein
MKKTGPDRTGKPAVHSVNRRSWIPKTGAGRTLQDRASYLNVQPGEGKVGEHRERVEPVAVGGMATGERVSLRICQKKRARARRAQIRVEGTFVLIRTSCKPELTATRGVALATSNQVSPSFPGGVGWPKPG